MQIVRTINDHTRLIEIMVSGGLMPISIQSRYCFIEKTWRTAEISCSSRNFTSSADAQEFGLAMIKASMFADELNAMNEIVG